jgi:hypothetical protein
MIFALCDSIVIYLPQLFGKNFYIRAFHSIQFQWIEFAPICNLSIDLNMNRILPLLMLFIMVLRAGSSLASQMKWISCADPSSAYT